MKSLSEEASGELFALNVTPRAPNILIPTLSELEFGENNTIYEPTCNGSHDKPLANEKGNLDCNNQVNIYEFPENIEGIFFRS